MSMHQKSWSFTSQSSENFASGVRAITYLYLRANMLIEKEGKKKYVTYQFVGPRLLYVVVIIGALISDVSSSSNIKLGILF